MVTAFPFVTLVLGSAQMMGFWRLSEKEPEALVPDEPLPIFPIFPSHQLVAIIVRQKACLSLDALRYETSFEALKEALTFLCVDPLAQT